MGVAGMDISGLEDACFHSGFGFGVWGRGGDEDICDHLLRFICGVGFEPGYGKGKMAAFQQYVLGAETVDKFGKVEKIRQGGDVGAGDLGVVEEELGFRDVGGQDRGKG